MVPRASDHKGQSRRPESCFLNPTSGRKVPTYRVDGHHGAIVGPGAQLHAAVLLVKGKVGDDDLTVAFEDGWGCPRDVARVVQEHFGELDDGKVTICTTVSGTKGETAVNYSGVNYRSCLSGSVASCLCQCFPNLTGNKNLWGAC